MSQAVVSIKRNNLPAPSLQRKSKARTVSPPVPLVVAASQQALRAKPANGFSWMKENPKIQAKTVQPASFTSRQAVILPKKVVPAPAIQTKQASFPIQAKLEIGKADDHYEKEADRVAGHVVSMSDSQVQHHEPATARSKAIQAKHDQPAMYDSLLISSLLQTKPMPVFPSATPPVLQKQGMNPSRAGPVAGKTNRDVESRLNASGNRGSPMSQETRTWFESRMGADFSQVRIHTHPDAVAMNRSLGSYAFAHGRDIYFNQGQYNPSSSSGRLLLAHELTHVIQQGAAVRRKPIPHSIARAPPSIQGFGISDIRGMINDIAINIPGFQLVTTIIGYNFILGEPVARTSANLILGFLRLVPPLGTALAMALQSSAKFQEACSWVDAQVDSLGLSVQGFLNTMSTALDAFSVGDLLDPGAAIDRTINFFRPYFARVVSFASSVFDRIIQFLRETVLRPLGDFARTLPGYPLLCVIMGKDPVTGDVVPRTAENFVHGFMSLIPGGEEKWQQLQQSRAIPRTFEWLSAQVQARNLTWERIAGTFIAAWDSLSAADVLHPIDTIQRIAGLFRPLLTDIVSFALSALEKILELIFEAVMGAGGARILAILKKARATFLIVIKDPVGFAGNLIRAVKQGIGQFSARILIHLREGFIQWLVGGLMSAGIQLPEQWDLKGILFFVMQILGLTYDRIRQKMVRLIGERAVTVLESGFELVKLLVTQGPMAAWQKILESIGNLRDMVLNGIREWIQQKIVIAAITKLASMFNPVGAVIQAILGIYNTIMFFIERINQIMALVESVVDSVSSIASGAIGSAANYVEQAMARTIPVILSFLSRLIGLGDIADPIRKVIQAIQARVDAALDKVVEWIRSAARRLIEMGSAAVSAVVGWWRERRSFRVGGESHSVYFSGEGRSSQVMMASEPKRYRDFIANQANNIPNIPEKAEALTLLTNIETTRDAGGNYSTGSMNSNPNQAADNQKVTQWLTRLAEISPLLVSNGIPLSTPPQYNGLSNGFGLGMSAERLTSAGPEGSGPSVSNPIWEKLLIRRQGGRTYYIRGHLLNDNVHGRGDTWLNLTPMFQNENGRFEREIEKKVKERVLHATAPKAVFYSVSATYDRATARSTERSHVHGQIQLVSDAVKKDKLMKVWEAEAYVPTKLSIKADEYATLTGTAKTNFISNPGFVNSIEDQDILHYNVDGAAPKVLKRLSINDPGPDGEKALMILPNIGSARAAAILAYLSANSNYKFTSYNDLVARIHGMTPDMVTNWSSLVNASGSQLVYFSGNTEWE